VETLLLISAGYAEDDVVIARHGAAIEAAEHAGVGHIVYTRITGAGDHLSYTLAHRWTERRLMAGSAHWTILRNGLYSDLFVPYAANAAATGELTLPIGAGRLAAVSKEDLADVAASVVTDPGRHHGQVYELVGDQGIGAAELAGIVEKLTGVRPGYRPSTFAETRAFLSELGMPGWQVPHLMSTLSAVAGGFLDGTGGDLADLLGRAPRPAHEVIAAAVTP
jgi:NAD(P)H dehydrogenase (quinone)